MANTKLGGMGMCPSYVIGHAHEGVRKYVFLLLFRGKLVHDKHFARRSKCLMHFDANPFRLVTSSH